MKRIYVNTIPQLKDNYSYILQLENNPNAVIIDPAEAERHLCILKQKNLKLECIILTHHHHDHTGGVEQLINKFPLAIVFSPNKSIKGTTNIIKNKDTLKTSVNKFNVISTPGHTLDHIVLYDKKNSLLFSGDTLFRLGCGRIFEGTNKQMYSSLQKINNLPNKTLIYCGHEYTLKNFNFLKSIFFRSKELERTKIIIKEQMITTLHSVPFDLGSEKKINPFLNQDSNFCLNIKKSNKFSNFELFKFIRQKKDTF